MSKLVRSKIALRRPASLAMQLADELRKRLQSGEMKPGDRLQSELEMMGTYGVSRTVVREAISSLKAEGLISTQQGVGAFVVQTATPVSFQIRQKDLDTIKEVIDLLELRISIETEIAALAAERRTGEQLQVIRGLLEKLTRRVNAMQDHAELDFHFHMEIARATGNHYFTDLFAYLGTRLIPRSNLEVFTENGAMQQAYLQRVNREHEDIFHAIERQDAEAARGVMRVHLVNSRERLRVAYSQAEQKRVK